MRACAIIFGARIIGRLSAPDPPIGIGIPDGAGPCQWEAGGFPAFEGAGSGCGARRAGGRGQDGAPGAGRRGRTILRPAPEPAQALLGPAVAGGRTRLGFKSVTGLVARQAFLRPLVGCMVRFEVLGSRRAQSLRRPRHPWVGVHADTRARVQTCLDGHAAWWSRARMWPSRSP